MRNMQKTTAKECPVVVFCGDSRPYPVSNERGDEILPCAKNRCNKMDGAPLLPRTRFCANIACGREFQSTCPGMIFCCLECFLAAKNKEAWDAAGRQADDEFAQAAKKKKEKTPEQIARKRARNHDDFEKRKGTEVYERWHGRLVERRAEERAVKAEAESEGGLWRNHKFVRNKTGRNATRAEQ